MICQIIVNLDIKEDVLQKVDIYCDDYSGNDKVNSMLDEWITNMDRVINEGFPVCRDCQQAKDYR